MSDAVFFGLAGLVAAGAIALALVWPQGLGARSPAPFGHALTPELAAPATPPSTLKPPKAAPASREDGLTGPQSLKGPL